MFIQCTESQWIYRVEVKYEMSLLPAISDCWRWIMKCIILFDKIIFFFPWKMISLFHIPFCVSLINILLGYKLERIFKLELSFRLSFCNLRKGMHVIDQMVIQTFVLLRWNILSWSASHIFIWHWIDWKFYANPPPRSWQGRNV